MCLGVPMQVVEPGAIRALCRARDGDHEIDMSLVGEIPEGTWVMVFLGAAREVISEETAHRSADAIEALEMAMRGESGFDHLFADLIDREPELPEFLRPAASNDN
ncbi:HypC/HybG/HupF family hydrogenase formation chaperone [Oricola sp.]|uniref:HypC/HybG/HupF family hydrogenase formation chaperone n=1 Tax=Oricola sp. TaxID=1979950 RepID=UPI000C89F293|nr:HypC/HybG/HupF family hydrogenase formation chaperone [Ahrensia sp.]